jgi:putative ABC transport system permease protein
MIRIIFVSAFRSLIKFKSISLINLLGLTLGITSFLFIQHYLIYEFSYDSFIPKSENVYRVNLKIEKAGQTVYNGAKTPRGLYFALKTNIPEVDANGIAYFEKCLVSNKTISFANQDVLWVDAGFEDVFPLQMVEGNADYSKPRTGIISAISAKALFGNESPIGKIIGINQGMPIEITGVFKDLSSNTHLTAQYFVSVKTWVEMNAIGATGDWGWNGWWNYIRLKDGASEEQVNNKINNFTDTYMSFLKDDKRTARFTLQPLSDLHFISGIDGEMGAQTNRSSLYNLIAIALVTLIIAWINYVNLAVTHAQARSRQIRMRKLIGASGAHLWYQSLVESMILNIAALLVSAGFYFLFLKSFAHMFSIPISQAHIPVVYMFLLSGTIILTGILLSSLYHGVALSGIKLLPANGAKTKGNAKNWLVLVQMALSIIFISCTIMVFKQIAYMKNENLGIELNDVVICTGPASLNADRQKRERFESFKRELLTYPGFLEATYNKYVPGQEPATGHVEMANPDKGLSPDVQFFENNASSGFMETYQMKLLAGNDFSFDQNQNNRKIIVNEKGMKVLGFQSPAEAVGQKVYRKGNNQPSLEIIGVVADFHNEGLQKPIYPIVWNNRYPDEFGYFAIRIHARSVNESINRLKTIWKEHYPNDNFDFIFGQEQFNQQYYSESRFGKFYLWLTFLSIGIAAMGLYGLVLFTFEKRRKEIGIRKVNGARVSEIMAMLNLEFIIWVAIAFVIAVPIAWYAMHKWLEHFAFKAELSWWIFALAGLLALGIALLTVSWQSWRAATRNPVEALRSE